MISLELPFPPTVNTYWRSVVTHGHARVLISQKGRDYRHAVHAAVLEQLRRYPKVAGQVEVYIDVFAPDQRRRDIDNLTKAPLDALTAAGVWLDDSQVYKLTVQRFDPVPGGRIRIRVFEVPAVAA